MENSVGTSPPLKDTHRHVFSTDVPKHFIMNVSTLQSEVIPLFANKDEGSLLSVMEKIARDSAGQEQVDMLKFMIESILAENVGVLLSRGLLSKFATSTLSSISDENVKIIGGFALEQVAPRAVNFEEQVTHISECVANVYEKEGRWAEAAAMLRRIPVDSAHRHMTKAFQLQIFLRITQLYLQEGDIVHAEETINRASMIVPDGSSSSPADTDIAEGAEIADATLTTTTMPSADTELPLLIKFKELTAHVMDRRFKFVEAAQRYYELSSEGTAGTEWQKECLQKAINCIVLSAASKSRSRLLTMLYKDERCHRRAEYEVLRKLYLEQIICADELDVVRFGLAEHQKQNYNGVKTKCGLEANEMTGKFCSLTLLQHANVEHNVVAASHIYANMGLQQLGGLLGVDENTAEKIAAQMIQEARLNACIDQIDSFIDFQADNHSDQWKSAIQEACLQVNHILENITQSEPDWMAKHEGEEGVSVT
eukprot:CFRG1814T1